MSKKQYLDYERLQYYHQKLKLDFESYVMPQDVIDTISDAVLNGEFDEELEDESKTLIDKTFSIPSNGFLRIRLGGYYGGGSGRAAAVPVEWQINNLTVRSNTDYTYPNAINSQNYFISDGLWELNLYSESELNGICIELLNENENNELQYFSTIGKMPASESENFLQSPYEVWGGAKLSRYTFFDNDFWNFVSLDIPVGASQTYCLNYYTDSSNLNNGSVVNNKNGSFLDSKEFQVTILHSKFEKYSVIFHWKCVE